MGNDRKSAQKRKSVHLVESQTNTTPSEKTTDDMAPRGGQDLKVTMTMC